MKALGILLFLGALGALAVFAWPLLHPDATSGPKPETFSAERSQAVAASAATAPRATAVAAAPTASAPPTEVAAAPPADDGPLCDRDILPAAAKALALPAGTWVRRGPTAPSGAWTWINLWAAWCKPCKEEMPLLAAWAEETNRGGGGHVKVLFLSEDDDERELRRYLDGAGREVRGDFLWVADEAARTTLHAALGVDDPPTLPVQALLDPQGRLRCVRVGSIDARALAEARRVYGL